MKRPISGSFWPRLNYPCYSREVLKKTLKGACRDMQNVKELSTKEIKQTSGGGGAGKNLIYGMGYGYLRSCNRL